MFDDRTKSYDFNKIDSAVRTKVITANKEKENSMTDAQKKLFSAIETKNTAQQPVLSPHKNVDISNLPSSKYLQSFSNSVTVGEAQTETFAQEEQKSIQEQNEIKQEQSALKSTQTSINFEELIESANEVKIDEKSINKEIKKINSPSKKSYSFRIKLVTGVYCILIALFGGWVIGNAIDIAQTNANLYETASQTKEVEANIEKIVLKIKNFDDASKNPDDDSVLKEMITETIETTPEAIIEPNEYVVESNWFDVLCNWLSRIFGGK